MAISVIKMYSFYLIVLLRNSDKWLTIRWSSVLLGKQIVIRVPKCDYPRGNDTGRRSYLVCFFFAKMAPLGMVASLFTMILSLEALL